MQSKTWLLNSGTLKRIEMTQATLRLDLVTFIVMMDSMDLNNRKNIYKTKIGSNLYVM